MSWGEIKKALNSDINTPLNLKLDKLLEANFLFPFSIDSYIGAADNITYATDTTLPSRIIVGDVITINAGVTVTTMAGGALFICKQFINNGTLTAAGKGAPGGAAVSASNSSVAGNAGTNGGQVDSQYVAGAGAGAGGHDTGSGLSSGAGGTSRTAGGAGVVSGAGNPGTDWKIGIPSQYFVAMACKLAIELGLYTGAGGGSGSAKAGSGHSVTSGPGGAGGGMLLIICEIFQNNGTISVAGVDGGNAIMNSGTTTYAGGGGAGAGGLLVIDCITNNATGTLTAAGGAPGTKGTATYGNDGGKGGDGAVMLVERRAA